MGSPGGVRGPSRERNRDKDPFGGSRGRRRRRPRERRDVEKQRGEWG